MAVNAVPHSKIAFSVVAALLMLLIAIIVRHSFWVSLVLGVLGTATFVYAAVLVREYWRSLPNRDKGAP